MVSVTLGELVRSFTQHTFFPGGCHQVTKPITIELIIPAYLARPVIQFLVSPFWDTSEARVVIGAAYFGTLGTGTEQCGCCVSRELQHVRDGCVPK